MSGVTVQMIRQHIGNLSRTLWLCLGVVSVVLGIAGIALPLLPGTPFLLLAAFSFSNSSERLHDWLIGHAHLGPPIRAWRRHRAISRVTKWVGTAALASAFLLALIADVDRWLLAGQGAVLVVVGTILWTQREPPADPDLLDAQR